MADYGKSARSDAQPHFDDDADDWVIVKIEDNNSLRDTMSRVINIPSGHTDKRVVEHEHESDKNVSDSSGKNSSACSKCDEESAEKGSNSDRDQDSESRETTGDEEAQDDGINESDLSDETEESSSSGNGSDDDENCGDSDEESYAVEYKDEDNGAQGDCLDNDACEEEEEEDMSQEDDESDGDIHAFYDECPKASSSYHNGEKRKSERARLDGAPSCGSDVSNCEKDDEDDNHYMQMAILNSLAQTRSMPLQAQRFARLAKLKGETPTDCKDVSKLCKDINTDNQKRLTPTNARTNNKTDTDPIVNISRQDQYGSRGLHNQSVISTEARLADGILIHPTDHPHCSVDRDELDGDTLEIHCNEERSVCHERSPLTSDSPSCSTRVEFTPAVTRTGFTPASIPIDGVPIRYSGGLSVESGRDNPQAKPDREVRKRGGREDLQQDVVGRQNDHGGRRRRSAGQENTVSSTQTDVTSCKLNNPARDRRALVLEQQTIRRIHPVLPPGSAHNGAGTRVRADGRELDKKLVHRAGRESFQATKQFSSSAKVSSLEKGKPTVPVHLRSTASYRDGQIDVSILGDQTIFGDENPVNVQVTFVHRQDKPTSKNADTTLSGETKQTMECSGPVFNKSMVIPPIKPNQNMANKAAIYGSVQSRDIKQRIRKTELAQREKLSPIKTQKRVDNPTKTKTTEKHRKACYTGVKKSRRKLRVTYSPQNFDIINYRSQWPPFNTSTNPETCRIYRNMVTGLSFIV